MDEEGWLYATAWDHKLACRTQPRLGKGEGVIVAWRPSCRELLRADACPEQHQPCARASVQARARLSGPLLGDVQFVVAVLIEQQVTDRSYLSSVLSISCTAGHHRYHASVSRSAGVPLIRVASIMLLNR